MEFKDLLNELKDNKIRLSHQRLKILEYLTQNHNHPTADQIYNGLHDEVPTLSKTTVYNTLNSLTEAGIVRVITIEDNETRYDITTGNHGHFKCESCGNIYDFNIDIDSLESNELKGFKIDNKNVYFKGLCPQCLLSVK
ncbi:MULTISPECIES: Fur family transcriptional regulator [unclassified Sedimentibacter]|uniref:Fur family transcriptional regulator n=1 Tax=unclassified Sedimentibacter TaxID=2649220 RepID=UPI0027E11155|nr:Fur family transcriptional regulator [Sedimentibacter sp. MB35-C1]WMJ78868.1 Fur family transcriptional regulator [Sedimentibacter sp. MB35-C1]